MLKPSIIYLITIKQLGLLNLSIKLMKMRMLQRQDDYCSNLVSSTEITCQKTKNYCSYLYNAEPAVACKLWQVSHCPRQGRVNSGKHSWTLGGVQWSWWPNCPFDCANAIRPPCWQETYNDYRLTLFYTSYEFDLSIHIWSNPVRTIFKRTSIHLISICAVIWNSKARFWNH